MVPLQKRRGWDEIEGWINHTELFSRTLSGKDKGKAREAGGGSQDRRPRQPFPTVLSRDKRG